MAAEETLATASCGAATAARLADAIRSQQSGALALGWAT
jgi:hypothetical protein